MRKPTHLSFAPNIGALAIALLIVGHGMAAGEKSEAPCLPRLPEDGLHLVAPEGQLL